jgi:hypothetical protein
LRGWSRAFEPIMIGRSGVLLWAKHLFNRDRCSASCFIFVLGIEKMNRFTHIQDVFYPYSKNNHCPHVAECLATIISFIGVTEQYMSCPRNM